jgi:hypothetical protein
MTLTPTPKSAHQQHQQRVPVQRSGSATDARRHHDPDEVLARQLFDEALLITVRSLRDIVEPALETKRGDEWKSELDDHVNGQFSHDILCYRDALRFQGPLQPVIRGCFPVPYSRWREAMRVACRARNRVTHPTDVVTLEIAAECTRDLMDLAVAAALECSDEIADVLDRIERASRGEHVTADPAVIAELEAERQRVAAQAEQATAELIRTRAIAEQAQLEKASIAEQLLATQARAQALEESHPVMDAETLDLVQAAVDALEAAYDELSRMEAALQEADRARRTAEADARSARASIQYAEPAAAPPRAGRVPAAAPAAQNTAQAVLPDPATVPSGTEMTGIKTADGLRRRPHTWVARRGRNGSAYWKHSAHCVH